MTEKKIFDLEKRYTVNVSHLKIKRDVEVIECD